MPIAMTISMISERRLIFQERVYQPSQSLLVNKVEFSSVEFNNYHDHISA